MICATTIDGLRASRRILVLGPSGSGKTVLSGRLGKRLGLPVLHLDAHFWQEGWLATPQTEWREIVCDLLGADAWIMDGTYESTLDLRLEVADAVVLIERSRWRCLWNVVCRSFHYRKRARPDAPPGQPLDRAFLGYIWRYPGRTRGLIEQMLTRHFRGLKIVLHGSGEIDRLISALDVERTAYDTSMRG